MNYGVEKKKRYKNNQCSECGSEYHEVCNINELKPKPMKDKD